MFCDCGKQTGSWPAGQAAPVPGGWLQAPLIAPSDLIDIVGESFRADQIRSIAGGRTEEGAKYRWHTAQLVCEDTNPFDPGNAVMVLIGGTQVGYIPSEDCPSIRATMARYSGQPFTLRALVTGGWAEGTGYPSGFGLQISADETFRPFDPAHDAFLPGSYPVAITSLTPEVEQAAARTLRPVVHLAPKGDGVIVGSDGAWWGALTKTMVARYRPFFASVAAAGLPVTAEVALTRQDGKRRARVMLPSAYTCALLMESASR